MKKISAFLVMLALTMSLCTVSLAADQSFEATKAAFFSSEHITKGTSDIALSDDGYIGFSGVDLTGIQSVMIEATCVMPYGSNGDAISLRVDSPNGKGIGYVIINAEDVTSFYGAIDATEGVHDVYLMSTYQTSSYVKLKRITFSSAAAPKSAKVPASDAAIVDNWHDTWAATDDLGRRVADFEEAGAVKEGDHKVGIMYWNWHETLTPTPYVISEVVSKKPEARDVYTDPIWDTNGRYYWGEPLLGFYTSFDYWVYRTHAIWLANAGVDAIFLDYTNGTMTYQKTLHVLMDAFYDAQASGVAAPKISAYLGSPKNTIQSIQALWFNLYNNETYAPLAFTWDGKPAIVAGTRSGIDQYLDKNNTEEVRLINEIYDHLTVRAFGSRQNGQTEGSEPAWMWLENYPLHEWGSSRSDGRVEAMTLGCSINHSYVYGYGAVGVASDAYTKGRGYTEGFGEDYTASNARSAAFLREQAAQILDTDPAFVYIDGWNEFSAGRQQTYGAFTNAFVDTYDDENSRDMEPTAGALKDDYYNLLVDFVRKYKGVRPVPTAGEAKTIDVSGEVAQWDSVMPVFINDDAGFLRDAQGVGGLRYTTTQGNVIRASKVSRDDEALYFYVETADAIKENTTEALHLYINADRNRATGWEGYDFAIGRTKGKIEAYEAGAWKTVGDAPLYIQGKAAALALSRATLGLGDTVNIEFKWVDGAGEVASGNFLDVYKNGSAAPMGRFNYVYTEIEQTALTQTQRDNLYGTAILKAGSNHMIVSGAKVNVYEPDTRVTAVEANGTLYIPTDAVCEILYGESKIEYDAGDNTLRVQSFDLVGRELSDKRLTYTTLGSQEAKVNGKATPLSAPVMVIDGRICLPLTYLSDCLGFALKSEGGLYMLSRYGEPDMAMAKDVAKHLN